MSKNKIKEFLYDQDFNQPNKQHNGRLIACAFVKFSHVQIPKL